MYTIKSTYRFSEISYLVVVDTRTTVYCEHKHYFLYAFEQHSTRSNTVQVPRLRIVRHLSHITFCDLPVVTRRKDADASRLDILNSHACSQLTMPLLLPFVSVKRKESDCTVLCDTLYTLPTRSSELSCYRSRSARLNRTFLRFFNHDIACCNSDLYISRL
jgi:hypothetical protein